MVSTKAVQNPHNKAPIVSSARHLQSFVMNNDTLPFGRWLKERRQSLDLTQENLADRVGCALSTIEKIERGLRRPSHQIAGRLAEALRIPVEERATFVAWARYVPAEVTATLSTSPEETGVDVAGEARQSLGNLPASATTLIGRDRELDETRSLLERQEVRLLTLLGPPGIGKTRLSLALASSLVGEFPDGVWFVPLASISDPALVASSISRALNLKEAPVQGGSEGLQAFLREREILLVLDNFEQVTASAPLISELLAASAGLKVLVTSRAALSIYGEYQYELPPLGLPDLKSLPANGALEHYPAVALFVQRAQAVAPRFSISQDNGRAIAEICARLDGLPLAIELAAARSKLFDPLSILRRLDRRLPLLSGGPRDRAPRQQSLRGAVAWSYDLLNDTEKRLFRRLSVFVGGCTPAAFEMVAGEGGGGVQDGLSESGFYAPEEELESLANKSLTQRQELYGELRFTMLETLREYALERLVESGEEADTRRKHAMYFLALAEEAEPNLKGRDQKLWLDRLDREHDNLRAALAWALACAEGEQAQLMAAVDSSGADAGGVDAGQFALRLGAYLWRFWVMRDYLVEGRAWLSRALVAAPAHTVDRARAANGAANLISGHGDYAEALLYGNESLSLYRELGDKKGVAIALNNLGLLYWHQSDYVAARAAFEESRDINQEMGDRWGVGAALANLGILASDQGDNIAGRAYHEQSAEVFRELGDKTNLALVLNNLAVTVLAAGDLATAEAIWEECLGVYRELNNKGSVGLVLANLALVARDRHEFDKGLALSAESLAITMEVSDKRLVVHTLVRLGGMAAIQEQYEKAATLFGACKSLLAELNGQFPLPLQADYDLHLASTRSKLDEARFAECWAVGQAMTMEEAVKYALTNDPNEENKSLNSDVVRST
jgi:predicted ATPase/DNA-binding XRE family transcriptional regulator